MEIELFRLTSRLLLNESLTREVALFLLEVKLLQLREREMVKGAGFGDNLQTVEFALRAVREDTFPEDVFVSFKSLLEQRTKTWIKRTERIKP